MTDSPITVDCRITGQKFDFDYDLDNTLELFMSDLQDQDPPMGFSPAKIKNHPGIFGIYVDGSAVVYLENLTKSLSELGAVSESSIIISAPIHYNPNFNPGLRSGLKKKRPSNSLKKR